MRFNNVLKTTLLAVALATPQFVAAESNTDVGAGTLNTNARINFRIIIPKFLRFQVGTGNVTGLPLSNATVDTVEFDYTGNLEDVGTGAAASSVTGDAVTVAVRSNGGQVTISTAVSNASGLANGSGDFISFDEISTVSSDAANLPAPDLKNTGTADVTVALNGARVTNRSATWTYGFDNSAVVADGTYTGTVTYTAATP